MTKIEFIKNIELYYTEYQNNFVRGLILKYISKYTNIELNKLFDLVINSFSNSYKIAPDIAQFQKAWNNREQEEMYPYAGNLLPKPREDLKRIYNPKIQKIFDEFKKKIEINK